MATAPPGVQPPPPYSAGRHARGRCSLRYPNAVLVLSNLTAGHPGWLCRQRPGRPRLAPGRDHAPREEEQRQGEEEEQEEGLPAAGRLPPVPKRMRAGLHELLNRRRQLRWLRHDRSSPGLICIPGRTTCVEGQCVEGDIDSRNCRELAGGAGCPPQTVCCKEPIGQGEPQVYALHCRNLKQDTNHCGTCNHACTEGKQPACCFGRCRDLHADPLNCGACVNRCPKTKSLCSAGQCRQTCPQGLTRCGNTCLHQPTEICCNGRVIAKDDLQFDAENCGDCGYDCSTLATAKGGCCGGECCDVNNPSCCSGQCTNVSLNEEHCGECGNACGPNSYCRFGVCTCPVPPCP
jgi:hypothetical protein